MHVPSWSKTRNVSKMCDRFCWNHTLKASTQRTPAMHLRRVTCRLSTAHTLCALPRRLGVGLRLRARTHGIDLCLAALLLTLLAALLLFLPGHLRAVSLAARRWQPTEI